MPWLLSRARERKRILLRRKNCEDLLSGLFREAWKTTLDSGRGSSMATTAPLESKIGECLARQADLQTKGPLSLEEQEELGKLCVKIEMLRFKLRGQ
jgi:hypothetical protein